MHIGAGKVKLWTKKARRF